MLQFFAAAVVAGLLLARGGLSQTCFSQPNCQGDVVQPGVATTARGCCAGTDEGMSFNDGTTCLVEQCILHGFASVSYIVIEAEQLTTTFGPNVKGSSLLGANIGGQIIAEAGTAQSTDFALRDTPVVLSGGLSDVRLDASNDDVTLEYGDTVILRLDPTDANIVDLVEGQGQFLRDTATVTILDNDLLNINFQESDYSFNEAAPVSGVSVRFRRTQSSFTLRLFPVNITEGIRRVGDFITIDATASEATAGGDHDFTDDPIAFEIPASPDENGVFAIPSSVTDIIDDEVDEFDQSFILVAEIGSDVPDSFVCFQRQAIGDICQGRAGATEIKIVDNDDMVIGFSQRSQTVSESQAPPNSDRFTTPLDVRAMIISEKEFRVNFILLSASTNTEVQPNAMFLRISDALFGTRASATAEISDTRTLRVEETIVGTPTPLDATIINDFRPEGEESFTIEIRIPDSGDRDNFECTTDEEVPPPDGFFCRHTIFIVDNDEPFRVAFVETMYTVVESEGRVEVCVNLTRPEFDILDETVQVDVFHYDSSVYIPPNPVLATPDVINTFTRMYPRLPMTDYEEQTIGINLIRDTKITALRRIICYNQTIYNDMRLEVAEYTGLGLVPNALSTVLTEVELMYNESSILIIDDDVAVVGLEETFYSVSEDVGVVEVCAIVYSPNITCPIAFPFDVGLSTRDNTAVAPMDYVALSEILMFGACQTRSCTNVTIVDDLVDEPEEFFRVSLTRTTGLDSRITLNPVEGRIVIIDNDVGITVGYELTVYTTTEGQGQVELCAVIFEPDTGGAPRPFELSVSTEDGTAVSPADYASVSGQLLQFNQGDTRICHVITINQDEICENNPNEDFFSNLALASGMQPITVIRERAQVIIDDNMEPECNAIRVGYEETVYTTTEGQRQIELCAIIYDPTTGGTPRPFFLFASTADGTAESPEDYGGVTDVRLDFAIGQTRSCHIVNINDDDICENNPNERFFSNLVLGGGVQPIIVEPPQTQVIIDDSNEPECGGITVGYEFSVYTTDETAGMVQICAIIYEPTTGGAPREFVVSSTTRDGSAIAGQDYVSQSVNLMFTPGSTRECHTVSILQDDDCEQPLEDFFADLAYVSGIQPININISTTRVIIDDSGEPECDPITVGYERTVYTTSEGELRVELCAVIFRPMSGGAPRDFVISSSTRDGTAVAGADYVATSTNLAFSRGDTRVCHSVDILQDDECEPTPENFFSDLAYVSGIQTIDIVPATTEVVIDDSNEPECGRITVGYEFSVYNTDETAGMVQICAIIYEPTTGGAPREFVVSSTTRDGSAIAGEDYVSQSVTLTFARGSTRECHTVTILQDDICEQPPENFFADLELESGTQPIDINIPTTQVIIDDSSEPECGPIEVGYERTVYTTSEGELRVELCAVIFQPTSGGAPRNFVISSSTRDGTAVAGADYVATSTNLAFSRGDTRMCHSVEILQDNECEPTPENFFSDLAYVSGIQTIDIVPATTEVVIDDSNEPECVDIVVGYEKTVYTTPEGDIFVELCVIITEPSNGMAPRPFILSYATGGADDTAVPPEDYISASGQLVFSAGDGRKCHRVQIVNNNICETELEYFTSNLALVSGTPTITVNPASTRVIIDDRDDCVGVLVNDTLTGDPLLTVPIFDDPNVRPGDDISSLCYEVHGKTNEYFNLISDECTTVNAYYEKAQTNSSNIDLNVVTKIGVRAVGDSGTCRNIEVDLNMCRTMVDGEVVDNLDSDGIKMKRYVSSSRVRISVPNCADTVLVMWVFCRSGRVEDPVTWVYFNINFIRYVVMRGLNLNERSHGLIGQFWNVPVEVEPFNGDFGGEQRTDDYVITVRHPESSPRRFVGLKSDVTWEFETRVCYYVGNAQAGKLAEVSDPNDNDSVIEGTYSDYRVDSLFATDFKYTHFNTARCI